MPEHEDDYDRQVGGNLRRLRLARGLGQEELARLVSERGIAFRQQTIVKIEKGQRPLRLREAHVLADALELHLSALTEEQVTVDLTAMLVGAMHRVQVAWETAMATSQDLLFALEVLRHNLDGITEETGVDQGLLNEAATLLQVDLDHLARTAPGQFEARRAAVNADYEAGVPVVRHEGSAASDG